MPENNMPIFPDHQLVFKVTITFRVINLSRETRKSFGSPPSMLKMEKETFGPPFRLGRETRAEHHLNRIDGEPFS